MMRKLEFVLAIALLMPASGCRWGRKAPAPPPVPKPASPGIVPPPKRSKTPVIPAPPPVAGTTTGVPPANEDPAIPAEEPKVAPPPAPAPAKPTSTRTRPRHVPSKKDTEAAPPAQQGTSTPSAQTPPPATAPAPASEKPVQLAELLPDDQRAQYEKEYQENVAEAQRALGRLQGRTLTSEQEEERSRAQNFLRQARESHDEDLRNAVQLSKRAAVLAQELEKTVR